MRMETSLDARRLGAAIAGLAATLVIVLYVNGIGQGFANSDEVVYAEFIRAMHRTGDWLTLRYQDAIVLQRPVAPISLYAAVAYWIPGETGLRLAPVLFTAGTAIAAGAIVWRRFGRIGAGVLAMLLVAATPSVFVYGRMVISDPPFVLCATIALGATMAAQREPRAWKWAAAALGGAFAAKSLAAAIPTAALAPWLVAAARRHRGRRDLRIGAGLAWFVGLAAPFYVIGLARHGGDFVREHFGYNLLGRAAGELEGIGIGGPGAYLAHVWNADGPFAALAILGGVAACAAIAIARRDARLGVAATYAVVTFAGLSAIGTRLPHYLLLFYPAAAVCAGAALAAAQQALFLRNAYASLAAGVVAVAGAGALLLVTVGKPSFDASADPSPETEALARAAASATAPGEPVHSLDWYAPGLGYYADRRWILLASGERMARIVGGVDLFRAAGNVRRVPPWPSGRIVVAGPRDRLPDGRVLAAAGDLELREVVLP